MVHRVRASPATDERGAVAVEVALVGSAFLLLLIGVLDIGLGIWNYNTLSHAVRQGTRFAIVRGEGAVTAMGEVGPGAAAYIGPESYNCEPLPPSGKVSRVVCQNAFALNPSALFVQVSWPAGENRQGEPVRVEGTYIFNPIFFGGTSYLPSVGTVPSFNVTFRSTSEMHVACCGFVPP